MFFFLGLVFLCVESVDCSWGGEPCGFLSSFDGSNKTWLWLVVGVPSAT